MSFKDEYSKKTRANTIASLKARERETYDKQLIDIDWQWDFGNAAPQLRNHKVIYWGEGSLAPV